MAWTRIALRSAIAVATVMGSTVAVPVASADAAGGCSGSLIEHIELVGNESGKLLGYLDVYYSIRSGNNCARVISSSYSRGYKKKMGVWLYKCAETNPSDDCTVIDTKSD